MNKILLTVVALGVATAIHAQNKTIDPKTAAYRKAYMERDSAKAKELSLQFLKDYPMASADVKADKANFVEYYRIYDKVLSIPPKEMNKNLAKYVNEIPYFCAVDFYYHKIELYDRYNVDPLNEILERSETMIKRMPFFKDHQPAELSDLGAADWKKRYDRDYYGIVYTHMGLLKKSGRNADALKYAEEALTYYGYKVADLNDTYVQLLLANGKKEKVREVLEAGVKNNQSTPQMLEMLKKDYKGDQDFDTYLASLKDKSAQSELEEHIRKQLIKKELPAFTVYDVNGKKVSSRDWAGKTIVLDFWASWCLPCKAAFPGMKMAQERLAAQKDVAFYFVVVHEEKPGYKNAVKKFIKDNNYPFDILFDGFDDEKSSEEAAKLLNVSGIPHKMVLDKDGLLRFSMTGYYGSPSLLADEIVTMVNMVKE